MPIVFIGHPSNFKVTRDKTSPILTQIGRFQTLGFQIPQICLVCATTGDTLVVAIPQPQMLKNIKTFD